jgi:predicted TIM-barrel fold metal-dependent hydrolase
VAFKSVIAYRTGLDIGHPSAADARGAFTRWRQDGFRETRAHAKPVRDRLLDRVLAVASASGVPVHIHSGGGDPDSLVAYARPAGLFDLLKRHPQQPVLLIHAGWPWTDEAAFIASILPHVYLDLSIGIPWASLAIDRLVETALGVAPPSKVLYGSDEASEPEVAWFAAHVAREALGRVLGTAVERRWLTDDQAAGIGAGVLAGNCRRLHGIAA